MARGLPRLGERLETLDAAAFTGRAAVLAWLDGLLDGEGTARVVLVHGPGGVGKSALLREVGRRAMTRGRVVWSLDARALEPVPGELERALAGAADQPGAVVLIDSFERTPALAALLRDRVLPGLAADALVLVSGRQQPGRDWFRGGWEHLCAELALPPLATDEAHDLLAQRGVTDPAVVDRLVEWAGGSPLALTLAAASGRPGEDDDLAGVDLNRMIVRRLAGDELSEIDADVLEVSAVARAVDARLLAAVLPGRPTRAANETLRAASVAELVGARVTLHDLVRTALRDDLRRRDPRRYGELRCRIADQLYVRATAGEPRLLSDLIELIDDREVRWGIGGNAGSTCRIDPWRHEEVGDLIDAYVAHKADRGWWDDLAPLVEAAPELGLVARDLDGAPLGFCVATGAAHPPDAVESDPVLAPLLADARARGAERTMLFRETYGLDTATADGAIGVLNLSAVLRSGLPNVERSYIVDSSIFSAPNGASIDFFVAVGAERREELDSVLDGRRFACWVIDHGPGGMLGQVREVVRAEAGLGAADAERRRVEDLERAALEALRFRANGRASDGGPFPPDAVDAAVAATFGTGAEEELLRRVVELADLDPTVTHESAMERLSVSRATYFRYLRRARERVARSLVESLGPDATW
jgi:predicted DNA-binding protein (UPF0251 family)